MRTRVKICGITRVEDARQAVDAGVDAIGLVFHRPSPRNLSVDRAREISRSVAPFVTRVALFMNADEATIRKVIEQVGPDLLQFHGEETADDCGRFAMPYIKALGLKGTSMDTLQTRMADYPDACAILVDGHAPGAAGGSGQVFDWSQLSSGLSGSPPIVLAGGLDAENVGEAIRTARPYAVDVSSGVESDAGIKDATKIQAFTRAVRRADADNER